MSVFSSTYRLHTHHQRLVVGSIVRRQNHPRFIHRRPGRYIDATESNPDHAPFLELQHRTISCDVK